MKNNNCPPITPRAKEAEMIDLAIECAEKQMRDGTASSQIITHYLKLATEKERLEMEKLELEKQLLQARTEDLKATKKTEELYQQAIQAMKDYGGH